MNGLIQKDADLFLFCSRDGGVDPQAGHGLYWQDTRHLSGYALRLVGASLNNQAVTEDRGVQVLLSHAAEVAAGGVAGEGPALVVDRRRVVAGGFWERFTLCNVSASPIRLRAELCAAADFADLFEVRGFRRDQRGNLRPTRAVRAESGGTAVFGYDGLDGVTRWTVIRVLPLNAEARVEGVSLQGDALQADSVTFDLALDVEAGGSASWDVTVEATDQTPGTGLARAYDRVEADLRRWRASVRLPLGGGGVPEGDAPQWGSVLEQGLCDLRQLRTDWGRGPIITAGTPWYAVPFGRDSLIAALQLLPFQAEVARGTLRTLAALQGRTVDAWRDEAPGKILHEARRDEMAAVGQVPFGRYYGSVDSTPLFLMLLGETWRQTGDLGLCRELLPAAEAALTWTERFGDQDGDGYLEYHREAVGGLVNQGWKDSPDSVSHRSGELAASPIALCEAQGYYYQGLLGLAEVMEALGRSERAVELHTRAVRLRGRFNRDFWLTNEKYLALGLDRDKRPIGVVTSNPGHCLWTGILTEEHAAAVALRLMERDLFSGWGLRTLSTRERRYDPLSYHNGSVWPHDTAIAAAGLARYGHREEAQRLVHALLDAAACFPLGRLPELFGGQERHPDQAPEPYPEACSPQAWAAGAPLMMWCALYGPEQAGPPPSQV